jgi:2-amino-4-hydroxy-6-hydroxymethyldihydropteridine diphosphokinase
MNIYSTVYLGLGSNVGNRTANLTKALKVMSVCRDLRVLKVSVFYETSAVGPRQRDFVNAAAKVRCRLSPAKLLKYLKGLEKRLGRVKGNIKWGPRKIDIDILFYGQRKVFTEELTIPHPEIANRLFVLVPLAQIAPRFKHPVLKTSVGCLKKKLQLTSREQKVKILTNG